jgi:tetratricopeptide (TPR) repeat protein
MAQEPTAAQRTRARELYGEGQRHFAAHEYTQALTAFNAAFEQVPNPLVLLGVASAQHELGQRAEERATLERYLQLRPDAPDRADVTARIAALPAPTAAAPTTGTVHVACTPGGATVALDGHDVGTAPVDVTASPGAHELRITLAGHDPVTRSITIAAGQRTDLEIALAASAAVASEGEPDEHEMSEDDVFGGSGGDGAESSEATEASETTEETPAEARTTAGDASTEVIVTTTIAGVALVTGTVFGFLALSKQSDFDAMPTASAADDGSAFALVADISFALAAAAGITAIVLYATETPSTSSSEQARLRIVPLAGPTGGGVAIGGSF